MQDDYRVRLYALTWLGQLYSFDDPGVRYCCIELASDHRQEVRKLARKGLTMPKHPKHPPTTATMVSHLMGKTTLGGASRARSLNAVSLTHALDFMMQVLLHDVADEKVDQVSTAVSTASVLMCADLVSAKGTV